MNLCTSPLYKMICLTSVSVFPYMCFVSLFSLKGCAQMALTSHHIHLNPGSQLTKQAPQGWRETDSHLLPTPPTPRPCLYTPHNYHKADSSAEKPHSPSIQRKTALFGATHQQRVNHRDCINVFEKAWLAAFQNTCCMLMNCYSFVICQSTASLQQSSWLRSLPE